MGKVLARFLSDPDGNLYLSRGGNRGCIVVLVGLTPLKEIADEMNNQPDTRPTCVELFAGAGGMMLGMELAGFRTLAANELHPHPCLTMRHNFPDVPIIEGSIRDFTGRSLLEAAGIEWSSRPDIDLLAGGPPCQGFSTAGLKDPQDPRNTLIGDYIRMVRDLRPRYFVLENVTGLRTLQNGRLFENVMAELHGLGYHFEYKVLFAADYGVPQMRKRLIVLGSRDGKAPDFPLATHAGGDGATNTLPRYTTCWDALSDLPLIGPGEVATEWAAEPQNDFQRYARAGAFKLENHETSKHRAETMAYYALVPPGGNAMQIPVELRNRKQGMQRWPIDGLSRTVTTEPTDFLHPLLNRIPTVRELARIQSFPDRFVFLGQRTTGNKMRRLGYCSQSQQVGNAVPPLMARAIGSSISAWDSALSQSTRVDEKALTA